ncbi:MAG TPA: DUF116 domain-containing protein [Polyangia bacterium]|jgi:hypothetical protein
MHADTLDQERSRALGDEWRDWDGHAPPDASAPKRLFFTLIAGFVVVVAAAGLALWYLVAPRLAQWHRTAPTVLLGVVALGVAALGLSLALVALMLLLGWPRGARVARLALRLLALVERGVFALGALLAIDRDRLAHAFVRTNNALVALGRRAVPPDRMLVLLPRCLSKDQLAAVRALATARGVEVAVVAGGEQARQKIKDHRPQAVVGVACERDLLSGIRDVRHRLPVVGIANTRPAGPCKDTRIELAELEEALAQWAGGAAAPPADARPAAHGADEVGA